MNDAYAIAQTMLLFKVLTDRMAKVRKESLNEDAASWMPAGTRLPVLIGGRQAGWVSMPKPRTTTSVADEKELTAFVEKRFPGEVETVSTTRIRPAFVTALKAAFEDDGGWVDEATGEVVEIPGLKSTIGDPIPRVEADTDAFEVVLDAMRTGELGDVNDLLALPVADGGA